MRLHATRSAVHFLASGVGLSIVVATSLCFALPVPKGNKCPQPEHTLVLNEFQVGDQAKPRWLEIINPGKAAVSLDNVVVRIKAKGIGGTGSAAADVLEFEVAQNIDSLPAQEVLLVGHLPQTANGKGPYFGLKLVDVGAKFQLPLCDVKIELIGPAGPIDSFAYSLCPADGQPAEGVWQTVMALDPDQADICANDKLENWCLPTDKAALTVPTPGKINPSCDLDGDGYTKTSGDCDDQSKSVNPLSIEQCNGIDDDCDGQTDDNVLVPQGVCLSVGICAQPKQSGDPVVTCAGVNGFTCSYKEGYEAANETKCDGIDNDCDGQTDEGMLNACGTCGPPPTEICNGLDDDCDGKTDELLDLSSHDCGVGVCALAKTVCEGAKGLTCQLPTLHEDDEQRCDLLDNDCDGQTDEHLGLGNVCTVGVGACTGFGTWVCGADDARVCDASAGVASAERCGDAVDNDCDGETDEGFMVGEQCTAGLGECAVIGKTVCSAGDPGKSQCSAKPGLPETETCSNGKDDDCDGLTDEAGCRDREAENTGGCQVNSHDSAAASEPFKGFGVLFLLSLALLALGLRRFAYRD